VSAGKVLIVEDDAGIAAVVAANLRFLGLESAVCADGRSGLLKASSENYSLVILDLMLPGLDGISVCARLREANPRTPILILTARSEESDRVRGLETGADDYVTKPFSIRELMARVKALLRRTRTQEPQAAGSVVHGGMCVDFDRHRVTLEGKPVDLTAKEFELLSLFVRNPGKTYSRSVLLNRVWGDGFEGLEHTVNSHINRLRAKIEANPARPAYLKTVWGVGYRFAETEELSA